MIEIKYNTRVFIAPQTKHIKIRVRWNKTETAFSIEYRADPDKWDSKAQRPISGTIHKVADQNCSARVISNAIEDGIEQIKKAFKKCEIDSVMPSKEILKTMVRGEQPKEEVKLKKTFAELFEEFLKTASDDNNCITLEKLTKDKMRELKNWYVAKGYIKVLELLKSA